MTRAEVEAYHDHPSSENLSEEVMDAVRWILEDRPYMDATAIHEQLLRRVDEEEGK